ncbi:hypothetical protein BSU04_39405 [Caballeronia sordidicola]|uniref:Uncharacterized protein n=1 Tax=Caballeronia sordidicola TaxID=196367 RepID=A0A226WQY6_CABSO|nr:hypothetical protein BSU04_39405 [Caballeronia sordidicola]
MRQSVLAQLGRSAEAIAEDGYFIMAGLSRFFSTFSFFHTPNPAVPT